jgi:hypothetical protein
MYAVMGVTGQVGGVVAVTDEVMPIIRDPAGAYVVMSWVLNDVLTHQLLHERRTWFLSEIKSEIFNGSSTAKAGP